jgi:Chs5-Arf1p-binding protein BUD7/BCH1
VAYRKTGLEWEILGDLGLRLHHKEEAKEAYQRALDTPRYSIKPWAKLLDMYAEEGDLTRTLQAAIRVAAYQYGEYSELSVCSQHDVIHVCFSDFGRHDDRSTRHR